MSKKLDRDLQEYWDDKKSSDLKVVAVDEAKNVLKKAKGVAEELLVVRKTDMVEAIKEAVEIQINGNLRDIKVHLSRQDISIKELTEKIAPIDDTKRWLYTLSKGIIYIGAMALAIVAILRLINFKW
jgi:hypothetical protein